MENVRPKRVYLLSAILGAIVLAWFLMPYEQEYQTCLYCRMEKRIEKYAGIPRVSYRANECSDWYAANRGPHEHNWKQSGRIYGPSLSEPKAVRGPGHSVFRVRLEDQQAYLASCGTNEAAAWFALLESEKEEDHRKAQALAEAVLMRPAAETPRQGHESGR